MEDDIIEAISVSKIFQGKVCALEDLNCKIKRGEIFVILGPSGCGKTTLLRLIAGLDKPTKGELLFRGKPIEGPSRDMAVVFQELGVFPWRSVISNVEFPLEIMGLRKQERRKMALDMLKTVGLLGFEDFYPSKLSHGMLQRVAVARALISNPDVLLMDEPFGSLDVQTRAIMQQELLRLHQLACRTIVFVTHSVEEAIFLGDRIAVFTKRPGKVKRLIEVDKMISSREERSNRFSESFIRLREQLHYAITEELSCPGTEL
ncbi:MAG: ABC transporter ATP-binding protein [Fervidobacterium sp.]